MSDEADAGATGRGDAMSGIIINEGNTFEFPSDEVTGQLVIPSIGEVEFRAPRRKHPHFELELTAIFPAETVAHHSTGDVRWMQFENHGGRLKNCWIVLEFEKDTLREHIADGEPS